MSTFGEYEYYQPNEKPVWIRHHSIWCVVFGPSEECRTLGGGDGLKDLEIPKESRVAPLDRAHVVNNLLGKGHIPLEKDANVPILCVETKTALNNTKKRPTALTNEINISWLPNYYMGISYPPPPPHAHHRQLNG